MDEEEGRTVEQSIGKKTQDTVKKAKKTSTFITKIRQLLAVPILGKIILFLIFALVIIFVAVGTISFFFNMPNAVRDKLAQILSFDSNWSHYDDPATDISKETLIAAAMDLMYKGYDLEDYGFVNGETYENQMTDEQEEDEITYNEDKTSIESIRSKVLKAYIAADNATYLLANNTYNAETATRFSEDLVFQIITEGNPDVKIDKSKYKYFFEVLRVNIAMYMDTNETINTDVFAEKLADTIKDFRTNPLRMAVAYLKGQKPPTLPNLNKEEILARINEQGDPKLNFSSGLIAFEGEIPEGVFIAIDREKKQMIVSVDGEKIRNKEKSKEENDKEEDEEEETIQYFGTTEKLDNWIKKHTEKGQHIYYYNLEGWVTKYSRPYEFSLALHLATMAPEFAYDVATSTETNAKVIMGLKETSVESELVLDSDFKFPEGSEGRKAESDSNASIIREGDILAIDQAHADIKAKYEQLSAEMQNVAHTKAIQFVQQIGEQEAMKEADRQQEATAESARRSAERNAKAQGESESAQKKAGEKAYENAYNSFDWTGVYEDIYKKIRLDEEFINWCEEKIRNYEDIYLGLTGLSLNSNIKIQNGNIVSEKSGEKIIERAEDTYKWKEEEYKNWTTQINDYYSQSFGEWALRYNKLREELAIPKTYHSTNGLNIDYDLNLDGQKVFAENLHSNGLINSDIFQLTLAEPDEDAQTMINLVLGILEPEYLMLDFTYEEIQNVVKIFSDIEKLYSLCGSIEAMSNEIDFLTYVPYIKRVTNHWFRNLTFVREGTEELTPFNAYIEDITRTNYQYYKRYFRWSLDPLIVVFADYWEGDPNNEAGTGYKYNVVEQRANAIEQIDNPRVTDNSAYIRSLINDKEYTIYDGNEKTSEELMEKEKINVTKSSINTYATLETLPNETSEILVRNLKELFKDTTLSVDSLDMEEFTEVSTEKPLSNIFPDYKPYVPWPNIFEVLYDDKTQMIFKARNSTGDAHHYLKAPTNGTITKIQNNMLEFSYRNLEGELNKLMVEIEVDKNTEIRYRNDENEDTPDSNTVMINMLVEEGDEVLNGADLVRIDVPENMGYYIITLSLNLVDNNGEQLVIWDYMDVPQRELTAEEIITVHNFIMNEGPGQGERGHAAIAACIFNRTISPLWNIETTDLISTVELTMHPVGGKDGSWVEKDLRTKLWGVERYPKIEGPTYGGADVVTRQILIAIAKVWMGYDPTKPNVPMGADSYAERDNEKYKYANKKYKCEISSHVYFGINETYGEEMNMAWNGLERIERYDQEAWQRRYLIYLCTTIKNSYYFENSDVLDKIIAWAQMEREEAERREEEEQNRITSSTR